MFSFSNQVEQRPLSNVELKEEKAVLEQQLLDIKAGITDAKKKFEAIEDKTQELAQLEYNIVICQADLKVLQSDLDILRVQNHDNKELSIKLSAEIEAKQKELATAESRHLFLRQEIDSLTATLTQNSAEIQRQEEKIRLLEESYVSAQAEKTRLIANLELKKTSLEAEIAGLTSELAKLSVSITEANATLTAGREEMAGFKALIDNAQNILAKILAAQKEADERLKNTSALIAERDKEILIIDEKTKALKTDYEQQAALHQQKQAAIEERVASVTHKFDNLNSKYGLLQTDFSQLEKATQEMAQRLEGIKEEVKSATAVLDSTKAETDAASEKAKTIISDAEAKAKEIIEAANTSISKREAELRAKEGEISLRDKWQAEKQDALIKYKEALEQILNRPINIALGGPGK